MTLLQQLILMNTSGLYMSRIEYQTDINAQVEKVYEYYNQSKQYPGSLAQRYS
jgi:hypothetical protein